MPIEVQRRELDAKLVVAAIAVSRGYKVLVGQDRIIRRLARFLPKGILFDKSIGGKGDRKVYRYNSLGYQIAAMDEEATGFLVTPEMFMETRMAPDTLAMTRRWFCISETVREMCVDKYPKFAEIFVTTGLGRTDTWQKPLVEMYRDDAEKFRNRLGRFILFNSNFGVPNHARGEHFVAKQLSRVESMYDAELTGFGQLLRENKANLEAYVDVLPKILKWFPEHKVVIRPHPAENVQFWRDKFREEPRICVEDEGVVTAWILASEFMIHHGCTTGVEAEIMGHPQVNYAPLPDAHHDTEMAKAFSKFVYTEDELKSFMEKALSKGSVPRMPAKGQAKYFASLSGKPVSEKIVDEFDKISAPSGPLPSWLGLLKFTPRHLAASFKDISPKAKAYSAQKFGGVSVDELEAKMRFNNAALKLDYGMDVKQVFRNLYMISPAAD